MRFVALSFIGVFLLLTASCVEETKHLGKKFVSIWDGTYVPDLTVRDRLYGKSFARTCIELEKEGEKNFTSKIKIYSKNSFLLLRCVGYVDKCHYKVNWIYKIYDDERLVETQVVNICKNKKTN